MRHHCQFLDSFSRIKKGREGGRLFCVCHVEELSAALLRQSQFLDTSEPVHVYRCVIDRRSASSGACRTTSSLIAVCAVCTCSHLGLTSANPIYLPIYYKVMVFRQRLPDDLCNLKCNLINHVYAPSPGPAAASGACWTTCAAAHDHHCYRTRAYEG
jgi:hypothetical protein